MARPARTAGGPRGGGANGLSIAGVVVVVEERVRAAGGAGRRERVGGRPARPARRRGTGWPARGRLRRRVGGVALEPARDAPPSSRGRRPPSSRTCDGRSRDRRTAAGRRKPGLVDDVGDADARVGHGSLRVYGAICGSTGLVRFATVGLGGRPRRHGSSNHHVKAGTGARIQRDGRLRGPRRRPRRGRRDGGRGLPRPGAPAPPGRGGRRRDAPDVRRSTRRSTGSATRSAGASYDDELAEIDPHRAARARARPPRRSRALLLDDRGAPPPAGARAPSRPVAVPRVRRSSSRDGTGGAGRPPGRPSGSVLTFGRHLGWSIGEIARVDPGYLDVARGAARGPAVSRRDRRHAPAASGTARTGRPVSRRSGATGPR